MSSDWWPLFVSLGLGAVVLVVFRWYRHYTHFARLGVPYIPPLPFVGNMLPMVLRTTSVHDFARELYDKFEPHPYAGLFSSPSPLILIRDPDIIRAVTIKDFDHFTDHVDFFSARKTKGNPLMQRMLFALKGKEWHDTRSLLSPTFTSTKMKNMFLLMAEIGQQEVDYLTKESAKYEGAAGKDNVLTLEMKDFFARVTTDIIATTAFGLKVDSLSEPNNDFYRMGRDLTNFKTTISVAYMIAPKLMELLGIPFLDAKALEYFKTMVFDTIKMRDKEEIVRHDFIHLLMEARKGELKSEEEEKNGVTERKNKNVSLTDYDILANAMIFFFGGFDTVSTVMTFCAYLLATNEDVQRRLHKEIDDVMQKSGGKPSYEQVMGCQYLEMVISESLRMYPPTAALDRQCSRAYRLPATDTCPGLELRPGDCLWIPIHGMHHDAKYFPEPNRFNPDRFSPENKHLIKPFTYNPFGSGPRFCIAQRYGMMETKVVLLYLLSKFSLHVVPKTPVPLKIDRSKLVLAIEGGAWLGIRRRSCVVT